MNGVLLFAFFSHKYPPCSFIMRYRFLWSKHLLVFKEEFGSTYFEISSKANEQVKLRNKASFFFPSQFSKGLGDYMAGKINKFSFLCNVPLLAVSPSCTVLFSIHCNKPWAEGTQKCNQYN